MIESVPLCNHYQAKGKPKKDSLSPIVHKSHSQLGLSLMLILKY